MSPRDLLYSIAQFLLLFSYEIMFVSFETLWTIAWQAPLSIGFPRQQYWSRLPFPSPGDHSHPGTEPASPALQADSVSLRDQGSSPASVAVPKS